MICPHRTMRFRLLRRAMSITSGQYSAARLQRHNASMTLRTDSQQHDRRRKALRTTARGWSKCLSLVRVFLTTA